MIDAMKQALETLAKLPADAWISPEAGIRNYEAMSILRQAIEQAEKQEPVAWLVRDYVDGFRYVSSTENPSGTISGLSEPLYTAPVKREWVGLTDVEVGKYSDRLNGGDIAREVEAKLRERNT
jgi:hypothetical protein